ncbi:ABC transporter permease [Shinella sp.]|uniref:ABC transporter permease n=1 Tax=Shinella sp. TaxID=1870904 RepID=UPI003F6F589F
MILNPSRAVVILATAGAVCLPLGILFYQSVLSGPFFNADSHFTLAAFWFVLSDPEFWVALRNSLLVATGMLVVALPLGALLALLVARTDIPGRGVLEPLILVPIIVSPVVLALGYVVAAGPVGFYTVWSKQLFGVAPWNIYSPIAIAVIGGLSHVPYVFLYVSTALKGVGSDVEEAARTTGAGPLRVALDINLPLVAPALMFSAVLVFFAGVEMFGLALVLGNSNNFSMLAVYLYKLTTRLGVPAYHLMATVAVLIVLLTFPLVMLQRHYLKVADKFVTVRGKAARQRPLTLGAWRYPALILALAWLAVTVVVPISGITLRAFVTYWGPNVNLFDVLTLDQFRFVFSEPVLVRGIRNSVLIGVVGGGLAVACYAAIAFAAHRRNDEWTHFMDYLILVPRAIPGLLAGLAFLWVFLFISPLAPLRATLFSIWLAYTVVWLPYGARLVSSSLVQVGKELEEAAVSIGATRRRAMFDVTLPLIRVGLLTSWLLVFLMFEREYSTGVYLLTSGTEVIGALLVTLSETGSMNQVAALAVINLVLIGIGVITAFRFGVRLHG